MAGHQPANLGGLNIGFLPRDPSNRPFGRLLVLSSDGKVEQECALDKTTMVLGR